MPTKKNAHDEPSVSVIISTLNRAGLLRKSLKSLEYQNYSNFEVVVVNGPSKDDTKEVCDHYAGNIKYGTIDIANLSKSRNHGINLSSGELVLFLDDDAFAEPDWISNIVEAYEDPTVGGVGTRVYDHTGFRWQLNPFLINKYYEPNFDLKPPLWAFESPDSNTIPHILGASSSFRRDLLEKIGGFDEEIEYFLDESELCRRVAELGYKIRFVDAGASVHHQFASGVTRDERRLLTHPYPVVKNKYYVCLSDWKRNGGQLDDYLSACDAWLAKLIEDAKWQLAHGGISQKEYDSFVQDTERGARDGRSRASSQSRKSIAITPANAEQAIHFPVLSPPGGRRTFCFISRALPRHSPGGVARYIWDLATGFARRGHETHLITLGDGASQVEFTDGLWIRHLSRDDLVASVMDARAPEGLTALHAHDAKVNAAWAKAAHAEVLRLRQDRYIDLVLAPAWDQEGLYCVLDKSIDTIVSMNTTFRRFSDIEKGRVNPDVLEELSTLEDLYIKSARLFHANSTSSEAHLRDDFQVGAAARIVTVPHGVVDSATSEIKRTDSGQPLRVLYVSRLERRKGIDIFLRVAAKVLNDHPTVVFDLVGKDSYEEDPVDNIHSVIRNSYPELAGRINIHGKVSDSDLVNFFQAADIFFVPSRYESFGIVFVEAMAFSLPVVALGVGGLTDIVENGVTGFLGSADDPAALAAMLNELIADPKRRLAMGSAARSRYERQFENETVVDATIKAFVELLDAPRYPKLDA